MSSTPNHTEAYHFQEGWVLMLTKSTYLVRWTEAKIRFWAVCTRLIGPREKTGVSTQQKANRDLVNRNRLSFSLRTPHPQPELGWNYPPGVLSWDLGLFISLAAVL